MTRAMSLFVAELLTLVAADSLPVEFPRTRTLYRGERTILDPVTHITTFIAGLGVPS